MAAAHRRHDMTDAVWERLSVTGGEKMDRAGGLIA